MIDQLILIGVDNKYLWNSKNILTKDLIED